MFFNLSAPNNNKINEYNLSDITIDNLIDSIGTIFNNEGVTIKKQKGNSKFDPYGSIIITGFGQNYIDNTDVNKGNSLQIKDDFLLPTCNNYFQYIMKYKDSSVETVGIRDNENGE